MAALIEKARNEGFLLTEGPGGISRDTVTLASGRVYTSGEVVIKVAPASVYSLATAAAILAAAGDEDTPAKAVDVAIVARHTDATTAAKKAAVIDCIAEVKSSELIYGASTDVDDLAALFATAKIKVRDAS